MNLYFAYGSNLDFDDWSDWCSKRNADPSCLVEYKRAYLPGFSINYSHYSTTREAGAANILPNKHGLNGTYGVLFEVETDCLKLLDKKEGHPNHYRRKNVEAITDCGEKVEAITYISSKYDGNSHFPPSIMYHNLIVNGLSKRQLPTFDIEFSLKGNANNNIGFIVAYGTLKRGHEREHFMPGDFVCDGKIKGDLYDLGPYPGLVDGNGQVVCEVYLSTNLVDDVRSLDQIEGTNLNPPLYQRKLVPVECADGKLRFGICYFYNGDLQGHSKIIDGNWT